MKKYNLSSIMKAAWAIRRSENASMAAALKKAWANAKKGIDSSTTKSYAWTTPKGAKIEAVITVEHITRKTVSADGWPVEIACSEWERRVDSIIVNGKATDIKVLSDNAITIGYVGRKEIVCLLPGRIYDEITADERREMERHDLAVNSYYRSRNSVLKAMNM